MPAASYSRTGGSRTTLGDGALDFRVRHGNGYFSASVATGTKPFELDARESCDARETAAAAFPPPAKPAPEGRLVLILYQS